MNRYFKIRTAAGVWEKVRRIDRRRQDIGFFLRLLLRQVFVAGLNTADLKIPDLQHVGDGGRDIGLVGNQHHPGAGGNQVGKHPG